MGLLPVPWGAVTRLPTCLSLAWMTQGRILPDHLSQQESCEGKSSGHREDRSEAWALLISGFLFNAVHFQQVLCGSCRMQTGHSSWSGLST